MTIKLFSRIEPAAEAAGPAAGRIVEGEPAATVRIFHETADGRFSAGTWRCTPGRWRVRYDETEYCRILEGAGRVIGVDGSETAIRAGDEFVVPAGFEGEWLVEATMTKRYIVALP